MDREWISASAHWITVNDRVKPGFGGERIEACLCVRIGRVAEVSAEIEVLAKLDNTWSNRSIDELVTGSGMVGSRDNGAV